MIQNSNVECAGICVRITGVGAGKFLHIQQFCEALHIFCANFPTFCPDFHQIKTFGSAVAPPALVVRIILVTVYLSESF